MDIAPGPSSIAWLRCSIQHDPIRDGLGVDRRVDAFHVCLATPSHLHIPAHYSQRRL
jgi:hypothetical protein